MRCTFASCAVVAFAVWTAFALVAARAQEFYPEQHFHAAFSAKAKDGHRESFSIPIDALNAVECQLTGAMKGVVQWLNEHHDWTNPTGIHCAKDGEAEL